MHLSASTTAKQLQELQASMPVDLITFTDTERTVSVRDKDGERQIRITAKTNHLNCSRLIGFRSPWSSEK